MQPTDMPRNFLELVRVLPEYVREMDEFTIDKSLAKGGFGEVFHATWNKDKSEVAIKKLFADKMDSKLQSLMIQEVFTTAMCQDENVIKLIGFTYKKPFSIITAYQKNGSLADYVYPGQKFFNAMQPNHLCLVALGMARAMHRCQRQNIIHRDLKPGNVLMNDKLMPVVCDFGIAGIIDFENPMQKRCGTPIYMAPEVYNSNFYDTYADVYSYGLLLYEMSEKRHVYEGETKESMKTILKEGKRRPPFSNKTPQKLRELIQSCWDINPDARPSFGKIYKMFAEGKVGFEGYDSSKMKKLAKELNEQRKHVHKPKVSCNMSNVTKYVLDNYRDTIENYSYDQQISSKSREEGKKDSKDKKDNKDKKPKTEESKSKQKGKENVSDPGKAPVQISGIPQEQEAPKKVKLDVMKLKDPSKPVFFEHLHEVAQNLQDSDINPLIGTCWSYLQQGSELISSHILVAICEGIKSNQSMVKFLAEKNIIPNLPMQTPLIMLHSFNVFAMFIIYGKEIIIDNLKDWVNFYIQRVNTEGTLNALSALISNLNGKYENITNIIGILVAHAQTFFTLPCASHYLALIFYILRTSPTERAKHYQTFIAMIQFYLKSENLATVSAAYYALAAIYDGSFPIDFNLIHQHSLVPENADAILALLTKFQDHISQVPRINEILFNCAKGNPRGMSLFLDNVSKDEAFARQIASDVRWYTIGYPDVGGTLQLFLFSLLNPVMRETLLSSQHLPLILNYFVSFPDNWILGSLFFILTNIKADGHLLQKLNSTSFFSKLNFNICYLTDPDAAASTVLAIEYLSKLGPIPDSQTIVDPLCYVMKKFPQIIGAAARCLAALSFNAEACRRMKEKGMLNFFAAVGQNQQYMQDSQQAYQNTDAA